MFIHSCILGVSQSEVNTCPMAELVTASDCYPRKWTAHRKVVSSSLTGAVSFLHMILYFILQSKRKLVFHALLGLVGQRCIAHCVGTTCTGIPKADTCTLYKKTGNEKRGRDSEHHR